jgi:protein-disulfide isomerase
MVEFSDFQCPYCKAMEPLLDRAAAEYPQIRRVWIHTMNRVQHPQAEQAAIAAQCAHEQGKFWEYRSQLFANQDTLSTTTYNQVAQSLGLSTQTFQSCLADPQTRDTVNSHDQFARRTNVEATPHVMVNGTALTGQFTYEALKNAIDQELNRATQQ